MSDKLTLAAIIEQLKEQIDRLEALGKPVEVPEDQATAIDEYIANWKEHQPPNMDIPYE